MAETYDPTKIIRKVIEDAREENVKEVTVPPEVVCDVLDVCCHGLGDCVETVMRPLRLLDGIGLAPEKREKIIRMYEESMAEHIQEIIKVIVTFIETMEDFRKLLKEEEVDG